MMDNDSMNWSRGCYEVQWQKNTSRHRVINRSPYKAVLGPIKCGFRGVNFPNKILNTLQTEDDLKRAFQEQIILEVCNNLHDSNSDENSDNLVHCFKCNSLLDVEKNISEERDEILCGICERKITLIETRKDCYKRQQIAAEEMARKLAKEVA